MVTPRDMREYVREKDNDAAFLSCIALHKNNYSIAELTDCRFHQKKNGTYCLLSDTYHIRLDIEDEEIRTALHNGLYVSAFLSRLDQNFQVHFLVHQYPVEMKNRFEEEIVKAVVDYMILKTIIALRLDSKAKIDQYVKIAGR